MHPAAKFLLDSEMILIDDTAFMSRLFEFAEDNKKGLPREEFNRWVQLGYLKNKNNRWYIKVESPLIDQEGIAMEFMLMCMTYKGLLTVSRPRK